MLVTNIVSFVGGLVLVPYFVAGELFGYDKTEKFLEKLNIILSLNDIVIIGLICTAITIATFLLRHKFFGV